MPNFIELSKDLYCIIKLKKGRSLFLVKAAKRVTRRLIKSNHHFVHIYSLLVYIHRITGAKAAEENFSLIKNVRYIYCTVATGHLGTFEHFLLIPASLQ